LAGVVFRQSRIVDGESFFIRQSDQSLGAV